VPASASEGERRRAIRHGAGEPEFEDVEGDVIARTHEIARWRETGEVAYERDFAVRLTLDHDRIVRIVVTPGSALPSRGNSRSPAD
jgi:hypothetical protein